MFLPDAVTSHDGAYGRTYTVRIGPPNAPTRPQAVAGDECGTPDRYALEVRLGWDPCPLCAAAALPLSSDTSDT